MGPQLNLAIVGCGGISKSHLPNMLKTPELRIWATMDVVEEAARERAEQSEAQYWTTDLDRILADEEVEAIAICATHDTHTELSVQAAEAGKHVFVEKPPAMTIKEARRLQRTAHEMDVKMMSGWWFKHSPVTKRLRSVIKNPYGVLFTLRIPGEVGQGPNGPEGPYGSNGILDNSGYNLHWIWHVMRSQPIEVYAQGFNDEVTNSCTILIRFANGGLATSVFGTIGSGGILPKHYAEVHAGPISAATSRFYNLVFEGTDEPGIEENEYHNGFNEEMSMFTRLCLEGGPNPMDMWEACVPTFIFEKAVESMRTRKSVPLDLEKEMYLPNGVLPASIANFGDV